MVDNSFLIMFEYVIGHSIELCGNFCRTNIVLILLFLSPIPVGI